LNQHQVSFNHYLKRINLEGFFFGLFVCFGAMTSSVFAQTAGYSKINLKNRVQIEMPDDWTINDANYRNNVREFAEKSLGMPIEHTAAFSAGSFPAPSRVRIRVSFIKTDPPIRQEDLVKEYKENPRRTLSDLASTWKEESSAMWAALAKSGVTEIGKPTYAVELIGGKTAAVFRYARSSTINPAETTRVEQYHIPLGNDKVLITLSYIEGDGNALKAHSRLKQSILIQ